MFYKPEVNGERTLIVINDEYRHLVDLTSDYITSHCGKAFLFLDKKSREIILINDGFQTLYTFEDSIPSLEPGLLAFAVKEDIEYRVNLIIHEYQKVNGCFESHVYEMIRVSDKELDVSLSRDIRNLFHMNGLINPHFREPIENWLRKEIKQNMDERIEEADRRIGVEHPPSNDAHERIRQIEELSKSRQRNHYEPPETPEGQATDFFGFLLREKTEWIKEITSTIVGSGIEFFL